MSEDTLPQLVCIRFQVLFHSPSGVLFAFPSRYWFTIGQSGVFSLGGWSPHFQTELHVFRPTRIGYVQISTTGLSPCIAELSRSFVYHNIPFRAGPRSLAATKGISVDFFSSGYLDVSVPRVRLFNLCIQLKIPINWWVSPFGNPRIKASLQANRGLSHVTTSFIASDCQGIHRMHLIA